MFIKKVYNKVLAFCCRFTNGLFVYYLKKKGIKVGKDVMFRTWSTEIDLTRPSLVTIGDKCYFNRHFALMTHDFVMRVYRNNGIVPLPSSGRVTLGNNVVTGENVMILKGVTIGDNVFIGANSLVTRDIPSNSIAAGTPCKVLMNLDDYYKKRETVCVGEALDFAKSIRERYNRTPKTTDFKEEFVLFVDGDKIDDYPEIAEHIKFQLRSAYDNYKANHKAKYSSFDEFLKAAGISDC